MVLSNTYDVVTPAGGDNPTEGDDRIREVKAAIQERMNDKNSVADAGDHYWPKTGSEVSDVNTGEHRRLTLRVRSAPTQEADKGIVYSKDVAGKAELFYIDEDGNEVQLTSGGNILSASLDSKDEDDMTSDSASHTATQQSIKGYVDNNVGAANWTPTSYAGEESITFPNGLILKTGTIAWAGITTPVAFAVAFPTAIKNVSIQIEDNFAHDNGPSVNDVTTSGFDIITNETVDLYYWQAWGY